MGASDEMTGRVAKLWRSQGEGFLERHHSLVLDDVARLRGAVVLGEEVAADEGAGGDWHVKVSSAVARMRGWDDAVLERLRRNREEELIGQADWEAARQPDAVIDLTGPEPVVEVPKHGVTTPRRGAATLKPRAATPKPRATGVRTGVTAPKVRVTAPKRRVDALVFVESAPEVVVPMVALSSAEEVAGACKRCGEEFELERLVFPHGEKKPPLCITCARDIAGFRPHVRVRVR
jgi:hypothetical protein